MADPPALRLYGYWLSMAAYRVRAALNLKGLQAEEVALDVEAGDQFAPDFLAVNPDGAVPTLVVDGGPGLTQSMAILEYLEERFPQPALLPQDLAGRARVRALCSLIAADTHPLMTPRVWAYLTGPLGIGAARARAWSEHWVSLGLGAIERRLSGDPATGAFSHGDQVTFADVCLCSLAVPARVLGVEVSAYPTVARVVTACESMDAFARAHPSRQIGAPASA